MAAPLYHMIFGEIIMFSSLILVLLVGHGIALPHLVPNDVEKMSDDICALPNCPPILPAASIIHDKCHDHNWTISRRCCVHLVNETMVNILGVDLTNCHVKNTSLLNPLKELKWIVLEDNPFTNSSDFEGLSQIEYLSLPPSLACPGGDDAWGSVKHTEDKTICEDELNTCDVQNVTCPKHVSSCHPDGPGMSECLCDHGRHGYKCLRTAYFPYIVFVLSICGATLLVSVFLAVTQRSRVKKKQR